MITGELEYVDTDQCQASACVRLPTTESATRCAASIAVYTMSRQKLTDAIDTCERYASLAASYGFGEVGEQTANDWRLAAEVFRVERRRRY
jgi:hypothetical protein